MSLARKIATWAPSIGKRKPLLGFDFDGTLVELQSVPSNVRLSDDAVEIFKRLSKRFQCAIITGRALPDLLARIGNPQLASALYFIGTHGSEIVHGSNKWRYRSEPWERWRRDHFNDLVELVAAHGGRIELKELGLTVHYRGVPPEHEAWWESDSGEAIEEVVSRVASVMSGIKTWNIIPHGAPNKGSSALALCRETGHDSLIYFGDEITDESVFTLSELPIFGVKVGPGETAAAHRVSSPTEVLEILRELA